MSPTLPRSPPYTDHSIHSPVHAGCQNSLDFICVFSDVVLLGDLWDRGHVSRGSPVTETVQSLCHEVRFMLRPEEWRTSVPGEPPGFSCKGAELPLPAS